MRLFLFVVVAVAVLLLTGFLVKRRLSRFDEKQRQLDDQEAKEFIREILQYGFPIQENTPGELYETYDIEKEN